MDNEAACVSPWLTTARWLVGWLVPSTILSVLSPSPVPPVSSGTACAEVVPVYVVCAWAVPAFRVFPLHLHVRDCAPSIPHLIPSLRTTLLPSVTGPGGREFVGECAE